MSYNEKKFLMRAVFVAALLGSAIGCGEITPLAPDGGGGAAGRETLSTGGDGGHIGAGGEKATGDAGLGGQAGDDPPVGGAGGGSTGLGGFVGGQAGQVVVGAGGAAGGLGTGGITVTIDAGASDASACPKTVRTSGYGPGLAPTALNGTSTGITQLAGASSGGGPDGGSWEDTLQANLAARPSPSNPPAGSVGSVEFDVIQDCNGNATDTDLSLNGYVLSFWLYIEGLPCDTQTLPIEWRMGVVTDAGTTFPWGASTLGLDMTACTGPGVMVQWPRYPSNYPGAHQIVLQFANVSTQAFSGQIVISDIQLTYKAQ